MDLSDLKTAIEELDQLSLVEYRVPLAQLADPHGSVEQRLNRIGRLVGVVLKQPMATPIVFDKPSFHSQAYRTWDLKPEDAFKDAIVQNSWQYHALLALKDEHDVIEALGRRQPTVYALAADAQHERGFFGYLAVSFRGFLCRDPKLRKEIKKQLDAEKRRGVNLQAVTPEMIVSSGGLAIGAALIQHIPILGMMGAPVIAGIVFIIYAVGIDAFCKWANDRNLRKADQEK